MIRTETKQIAELYLKANTFVNIKHKLPSGKIYIYNGHIIKIYEDFLEFKDRIIPNTIPIYFESIVGDIEVSLQKENK